MRVGRRSPAICPPASSSAAAQPPRAIALHTRGNSAATVRSASVAGAPRWATSQRARSAHEARTQRPRSMALAGRCSKLAHETLGPASPSRRRGATCDRTASSPAAAAAAAAATDSPGSAACPRPERPATAFRFFRAAAGLSAAAARARPARTARAAVALSLGGASGGGGEGGVAGWVAG